MPTKPLLTQRELAARWSISPRTLEAWRWRGEGPDYIKIRGRVLYPIEVVEAYEQAHLVAASDNKRPANGDKRTDSSARTGPLK